jgi:hypothetical protein
MSRHGVVTHYCSNGKAKIRGLFQKRLCFQLKAKGLKIFYTKPSWNPKKGKLPIILLVKIGAKR